MATTNRKRGADHFLPASGYMEDGLYGHGMSSPRKKTMTGGQVGKNPVKYPETISAFADGIKTDFFDIFSSGANALGSTVRMFFPMHSVDETTEDSLNDIEVNTPAGGSRTPLNGKVKKSYPSPSPIKPPIKQKVMDTKDALRMRCSTLWSEADQSAAAGNVNSTSDKSLDEATHGQRERSESKVAKRNNAKAKEGGKVLISKLEKNPTIQYFPCGKKDENLIILGNLRMIHCSKNHDEHNTATIIWCEKFQEIASCVISCAVGMPSVGMAGQLESKLDITTRDDRKFSVLLQDTALCVEVMQIIQKRCLPVPASTSRSAAQGGLGQPTAPCSSLSVDLLGIESFSVHSEKEKEMAPLSIGSSPTKRTSRRLANKRPAKSKLMVNIKTETSEGQATISKENCIQINRLPPPPTGAAVDNSCTNLIDFSSDELSPAKRMKLATDLSHDQVTRPPNVKVDLSSSKLLRMMESRNPKSEKVTSPPVQPAIASAHLKKYTIMLKSGVPLAAVKQKMTLEGVTAEDITLVCSVPVAQPSETGSDAEVLITETALPTAPPPADVPSHLKKYQIMMKSGVPHDAVKQKMALEGVGPDEINVVFGIKTPVISPSLKKFQVMLKSGIPAGAVGQKMCLEGISSADQALVLGKSSSALPCTPGDKGHSASSGPQLLGLHWDPIANHHDSLSKSVWGDIHSGSAEEASHQLQEEEFDSLSTMFSRKATPAKPKAGDPSPKLEVTLRSKSKMPTTIDMSRSTNISIGMSSFKQKKLSAEKIARAINALDTGVLKQEDLSRLYEILPSDSEVKIFSGKMSVATIEGFHDTEKWLHQLSAIDKCKEKVTAMIFMTSYTSHAEASGKDLQALVSFSELVVGSAALKEVMKCILAIGNSLNKGTYKGGARGFRLGSLLKLQQTKSTDGKSTVMDYLIQVLHARYVTGDLNAGTALSLNNELSDVNQAKSINVKESVRDVSEMRKQFEKLRILFNRISEKDNNLLIDTDFENVENKSVISQFIAATETSLQNLEALRDVMLSRCDGVIQFFGEEDGASVQHMYTQLAEFVGGYAQSKKKFEDNLRKESRLRAAAAKKANRDQGGH